jgi:hypothetical protein
MPFCSTCGTQISLDTTTCPSCGRPQVTSVAGPRRSDSQAIASLILGIVGITMCPFVPSIIAVIIGNQAKQRIEMDPTLQGAELARVGVILGWIGIAIGGVGVLFALLMLALSIGSMSL